MVKVDFVSKSENDTLRLANIFGELVNDGQVILLTGDLGVGKTVFAKGLAKGLGIIDTVNSPTFNIVKCYFKGRIPMFHIDAYRLEGNTQDIGLDEYIEAKGVCLIEWPIYISYLLPKNRIELNITRVNENERHIEINAIGEINEALLKEVKSRW